MGVFTIGDFTVGVGEEAPYVLRSTGLSTLQPAFSPFSPFSCFGMKEIYIMRRTDDDNDYLEENNFRSAHRERPHNSSRSAEVVIVWQTADTFLIVHIALYCRLPIPFSPTPCW